MISESIILYLYFMSSRVSLLVDYVKGGWGHVAEFYGRIRLIRGVNV